MSTITEIIPKNMPDWFKKDMEDGQVFCRMVERVEQRDNAIKYLLSFAPNDKPEEVPKGLDPTFYHTLNYSSDVKIAERIQQIKLLIGR